MKKIFAAVICLLMMLCFASCEKAPENETPAPDYDEIYEEILEKNYQAIVSEEEDPLVAESEWGVFEAAEVIGEDAADKIGYVISDINGDGTKELLIGCFEAVEGAYVKNELYSVYTVSGGKAVLAFSGTYRSGISLMDGGRIFSYGSESAAASYFGEYELGADGGRLCVDFYFSEGKNEELTESGYYHNTTGETDAASSEELDMTEDEFWSVEKEYAGRTVVLEGTPFSARG